MNLSNIGVFWTCTLAFINVANRDKSETHIPILAILFGGMLVIAAGGFIY
jgi:hypothetical protein